MLYLHLWHLISYSNKPYRLSYIILLKLVPCLWTQPLDITVIVCIQLDNNMFSTIGNWLSFVVHIVISLFLSCWSSTVAATSIQTGKGVLPPYVIRKKHGDVEPIILSEVGLCEIFPRSNIMIIVETDSSTASISTNHPCYGRINLNDDLSTCTLVSYSCIIFPMITVVAAAVARINKSQTRCIYNV